MESSLFNSFVGVINSCFSWFTNFFSSLPEFFNLLLCVVIFITIYRFLLAPLFGGGSYGKSDSAKKSKKHKGDPKE